MSYTCFLWKCTVLHLQIPSMKSILKGSDNGILHLLLLCLWGTSYLLTYIFTYFLTPWCGVLEKLVKKFPAFYGRSIWILSYHLCLGLPSGLFPSCFPTKTLNTPLPPPIRATCPFHLILLDLITWRKFGAEYRSPWFSLCSFLHSLVTLSLLGPNILLCTLFSNTFSLRSSLTVSDQGSHLYKTADKIIVLYILMCYTFNF